MGMFMGMLGRSTPRHWRIRGKTYYGRLAIPTSLRAAYDGRQVLEQSLETRDYAEAMARLGSWLQKWKAEFSKARAASDKPKTDAALISPDELERLKQERSLTTYERLLSSPVSGQKETGQQITSREGGPVYIEEAIRLAKEKGLTYSDPSELLDVVIALNEADETALELFKHGHKPKEIVKTEDSADLLEHLNTWLEEQYSNGKTRAEYKSVIFALNRWLTDQDSLTGVGSISRAIAGSYVSYLAGMTGKKTTQKKISALSQYWGWLDGKGLAVGENVWAGQPFPKTACGASEVDDEPAKRAFSDDEVAVLLADVTQQPLADIIRIAALSGMTVNEIASLRVGDCAEESMTVRQAHAKNRYRRRDVPIHSALRHIIDRRMYGKSNDDYLFEEIRDSSSEARNRGSAVSTAFTRARRKHGVHDQPAHLKKSRVDFHSFRRWFTTKAMNAIATGDKHGRAAGFTKYTVDDVTGHVRDKKDMPGGVYQGPSTAEMMKACVEAVRLPGI